MGTDEAAEPGARGSSHQPGPQEGGFGDGHLAEPLPGSNEAGRL